LNLNLLIIGSGWLAQPLAQHWQRQGHAVRLTTRQTAQQKRLQRQNLTVDLFALGDDLSAHQELDAVVFATTCQDLKAHQSSLNTLPSNTGKLFISSTSVCANDGQTHTETSTALNPESPLQAIEACFQQDPQASILRLAGLVGPQRHPGRFGRLG
jgi:nucleoside-diphosphate-sugar epimerase